MYFLKLALLFAFTTATTIDAAATSKAEKCDPCPTQQCSNANDISVVVDETIDGISYSGLTVLADSDGDQKADGIVGHLTFAASRSGARVTVELFDHYFTVQTGKYDLALEPSGTFPILLLNGKHLHAPFHGFVEAAQEGVLDGDLYDLVEGFQAALRWINAHSQDVTPKMVGSCTNWEFIKRYARVGASCAAAGVGWAVCAEAPTPMVCLGSLNLSVTCVSAVEHYFECAHK